MFNKPIDDDMKELIEMEPAYAGGRAQPSVMALAIGAGVILTIAGVVAMIFLLP